MDDFWRKYWTVYDPAEATSEEDLFKQVAHTVNKQPIAKELFIRMLGHIVTRLQLSKSDHLLDLCCGNGLFSHELAAYVGQVTGIDFVSRNVRTAQLRKSLKNTNYIVGDATESLFGLLGAECLPNKFLMHYSLAYFVPNQFATILSNILDHLGNRQFQFLCTGIPNFDLKWNFYDTPERRARHLENEKQPVNTNDGLGGWWRASEIEETCRQHGLNVLIENQPPELSNYRMDALISSSDGNR